uniref:Uncharacterized protein n=1 Tax=Anguilla anguilla TaxID=7936 RepID=A0A0E9UNS3_ANGAN
MSSFLGPWITCTGQQDSRVQGTPEKPFALQLQITQFNSSATKVWQQNGREKLGQ